MYWPIYFGENIITLLGYRRVYYTGFGFQFLFGGFFLIVYLFDYREYQSLALLIGGLLGIVIPFVIYRTIKCPKCEFKIYWHFMNRSPEYKDMGNPFEIMICPKCGYDPMLGRHEMIGKVG